MSDDLKKKLENCEKQKKEYLDGWKRAKADFINYKKEEAERLRNFAKAVLREAMADFISVLDSFDLGLFMSKGETMEKKGVMLIKSKLEDVLKRQGIQKIKVSVGDKFDPARHEAVQEVESEQSSGTIVEEVESGYTLNGEVLRPARVKVAK